MKWAVAAGYRGDDPAGDAISAALPKHNGAKRHMRALPHAEVGAALERVRESGAWAGHEAGAGVSGVDGRALW